jgi:hypothetical protein
MMIVEEAVRKPQVGQSVLEVTPEVGSYKTSLAFHAMPVG